MDGYAKVDVDVDDDGRLMMMKSDTVIISQRDHN